MAGTKLPPRQKMIGLMYLVLLALLAINVSKDILDAFILVNDGLETTITNYQQKNDLLYAEFNNAKSIDSKKITPYWEKANRVKTLSENLIKYIDEIKTSLIMETEKIPKEEADTIQLAKISAKDNYDDPTRLMIGEFEDGSNGLAKDLKEKINSFEKELLSLIDDHNFSLDLKTEGVETPDGFLNWEMRNFDHTPLVASITLLSKLQTDIKNAEYETVNKLFQSVRKNDFTFDTIAPKIISPSNYVMIGEKYNADIFIAAFSKTQNPEILIGKLDENDNLIEVYDTVSVSNGMGKYSLSPSSEGIHQYEGIIKMISPTGTEKKYPFRSEFIAAKPNLVVSPDAMNVMYIGPENPISISVPGVASENITATITGAGNKLIKTSNGKYKAILSRNSPKDIKINVNITSNGTVKPMGNMDFKVKNLPIPYAEFSGVSGTSKVSLSQLKNTKAVRVTYGPDFVFQGLPISVSKFNVEVVRGGDFKLNETCYGHKLNNKASDFFEKNLSKYDVIYISNIITTDVSGLSQATNSAIKIIVK